MQTNDKRTLHPVSRRTVLTGFTSVPGRLLALMVAVLTAVAITPPAVAHAAVPDNYIFNNSSVGIGVWHDYHSGSYDGTLSAYSTTSGKWGWDHASKFYVGSGYCFSAYRRPVGSSGSWQFWISSPGPVTYPDGYYYKYDSSWWNYDWQIHLQRRVNNACGPRV